MEFKIFLDTNIFLDHLQDRNKFSTQIIKLCERNDIDAFASTASFYTLAYFIGKYTELNIRRTLEGYSELIELIPTTKENLYGAYQSGFKDMEDAFQYYTALNEADLNFFVTNNIKDYKRIFSRLPVIAAKNFIDLMNNEK